MVSGEMRNTIFQQAARISIKRFYEEGWPFLHAMGWQACLMGDTVSIFNRRREEYVDIRISPEGIIVSTRDTDDLIRMGVFREPFELSMAGSLYELLRSTVLEVLDRI